MPKLFTCSECGYALLPEAELKPAWSMVWTEGRGWHLDPGGIAVPHECADQNECHRRRRDEVAGGLALAAIDKRHQREMKARGLDLL